MQAGLERPWRPAEFVGDLRESQPHEVMQDEDRALLRRDPPEGTLEEIAFDDTRRLVATSRPVGRQDTDIGGPGATPPRLRVARVDEDPPQPGIEPVVVAQRRQLAP